MALNDNDGGGKLDKFHLFTKLPTELQLLVWKFYREGQPVLYHHMSLTRRGRVYSARDMQKGELVTTTAQSANQHDADGQALDPAEYKIRFVNGVIMKSARLDVVSSAGYYPLGETWKSPAETWVNFEKDVFFLDSSYDKPGQLRFLFRFFNRETPMDIPDDHWAHRIRQLAIYVDERHSSLADFDRRAFGQLRGLRRVWLVVCRSFWRGSGELVDINIVMASLEQSASYDVSTYRKNVIEDRRRIASGIRDELRQIFQTAKRRGVVIDIVCEGHMIRDF
ncbi:hypothetical protein F5Y18DRAFT_256308 [Xylariaceae sp. FL1019]|nr:hypothetical protein F5Y18DRAFT_256308 [Xylariaceae sp. FL1019]